MTGSEVGAIVFLVVRVCAEVEGLGGDVVLGECSAGEERRGEEGGELHVEFRS